MYPSIVGHTTTKSLPKTFLGELILGCEKLPMPMLREQFIALVDFLKRKAWRHVEPSWHNYERLQVQVQWHPVKRQGLELYCDVTYLSCGVGCTGTAHCHGPVGGRWMPSWQGGCGKHPQSACPGMPWNLHKQHVRTFKLPGSSE